MLHIRKEQMETLRRVRILEFHNRMLAHLRKFFPEQCETLGERGMQQMIDEGIEQAASFGIVGERDVSKFIDLMFALGQDFCTALPWAQQILRNHTSPQDRMQRLIDTATKFINQGV